MRTFVGTSGWSYREWKGSFYPAKFPARGMLTYYAERFPTVEVNNSFYRIPSERVLAAWAEQVPPQFRFVMKASRWITHNRRLRVDDGSLTKFLRAVSPLGDRLGPTLFQLAPTFQLDLSNLRNFLERLPKRWPAALEFRHPSWFVDEVYEVLSSRDVPLVTVDEHREDGDGVPLVPTASWGYLRLRRGNYSTADLVSWAERIETQGWTDTYVFLKHEEGSPEGPAVARELNAILTGHER
jgi:uncharacterized protein YecE (DUF72 family)